MRERMRDDIKQAGRKAGAAMTRNIGLDVYVIYDHPRDFPNKFVVRKQTAGVGIVIKAPRPTAVCDTLDEARRAVPFGLLRLDRHPQDDPVIVETWL